jgi:hypothetical protein
MAKKQWPESSGGTRRYYSGPMMKSGRWSPKGSGARPFHAVFKIPEKVWKSILDLGGK